MRRLLLFCFFVFSLFIVKSISAQGVSAASIEGYLDNRTGSIAVTVTVNYYKSDNSFVSPALVQTVAAGARQFVAKPDTSDLPPYRLNWSTACDFGSQNNITGSGGIYIFADQDVHCKQPNATVSISSTSCPINTGSVSWKLINVGVGGPNVDYFKIYKSLGGDPDLDSSPITQDYSGSPGDTRNQDLGALNPGIWNIKVKAFTNAPDNNLAVDSASMNCGAGLTSPSALYTNLTCNSNQIRVDFSWGAAQSGAFNYLVQTNAYADPGYNGTWSGNSYIPNPPTITIVSAQGSWLASTIYYWRVKATRQSDGAIIYSPPGNFTTSSTCSGTIQAPSLDNPNTMANVCAPNIDYDWDVKFDTGWPLPANPDSVAFRWRRAQPISSIVADQEFVDVSVDSSFLTGVTSFNVYDGTQTTIEAGKTVNFAFADNTDYFWRVKTKMTDGNWYYSQVKRFYTRDNCTNAPYNTTNLFAATTYCLAGNVIAGFNWKTDGSQQPSKIDTLVYQDSFGGTPVLGSFSTGYNDEWVATAWNANYWAHTYYVEVGYFGNVNSNVVSFTLPNCTQSSIVNTPNGLDSVPAMQCDSGSLNITFNWTDRSVSETSFQLDISTEPFTSDGTTNPSNLWGRKTVLPQGTNQPVQTGFQHSFVWSSTNQLDMGDANPADPSTALVPLEGTVYYWRVRAVVDATTTSFYKYPDGADNESTAAGTFDPAGAPFVSISCTPKYDLSLSYDDGAGFKNWNKQSFEVGEDATLQVTVVNRAGVNVQTSPATKIYLYKNGTGLPSCPSSSQSSPPANAVEIAVPDAITAGSARTYSVTFNVGSTPGQFTAQAYVTPACNYLPDTGTEIFGGWTNNRTSTGFTYTVGVKKFFESQGGDVGAVGRIATGVDSTDPNRSTSGPWPAYYQSGYLLAGGDLPDLTDTNSFAKVKASPAGYRIDSYSKNFVAGGIYDYFYGRFRNKATNNFCSSTPGQIITGTVNISGLNYCTGDVQITGDITINGSGVIFIDNGDLDIRGNITASGTNGVVFIVDGDIVANYSLSPSRFVTNIDGIFVARNTFHDNGLGFGGAAGTTSSFNHKLRVNGAVYADGASGTAFDLSRYFAQSATVLNLRYPVDEFYYDPKYLILLSNLLSVAAVGWEEVAP